MRLGEHETRARRDRRITGAAPMLDEVLDLTAPHTACDRRIAKLEDDNRQLRCDLARALAALGRDEATG